MGDYLRREEYLGRICRVRKADLGSRHMISPVGVIPKHNRPGKWRLIVHLSAPEGNSVNNGISSELSSVCYASIDDAVFFIRHLGGGCLLAKLDLMEAYRAVQVHPSDQPLLAVKWDDSLHRSGHTFWPEVGPENLLSLDGRHAVDTSLCRGSIRPPLLRRLPRVGPNRLADLWSGSSQLVGSL